MDGQIFRKMHSRPPAIASILAHESQEIFSTRERLRKHGFRMNNKKSWEHREWIQQACIKKRLDARNRMCRISCIEKKTVSLEYIKIEKF